MCNDKYPRVTAKIGDRIVDEDDASYRSQLVERVESDYPGEKVTWFWRDRPGEGDVREISREELLDGDRPKAYPRRDPLCPYA